MTSRDFFLPDNYRTGEKENDGFETVRRFVDQFVKENRMANSAREEEVRKAAQNLLLLIERDEGLHVPWPPKLHEYAATYKGSIGAEKAINLLPSDPVPFTTLVQEGEVSIP